MVAEASELDAFNDDPELMLGGGDGGSDGGGDGGHGEMFVLVVLLGAVLLGLLLGGGVYESEDGGGGRMVRPEPFKGRSGAGSLSAEEKEAVFTLDESPVP